MKLIDVLFVTETSENSTGKNAILEMA